VKLLAALIAAYLLGWMCGLQDGLHAPVCAACESEILSCADDLAEAEVTLTRARMGVTLAEVVLTRGLK
jgi:hypothetical protein